jgi:hypothetical protein
MIQIKINAGEKIWGVGNTPPINMPTMVWTPYLQTYEPQSFNYLDTNECSQLGGFISPIEIYFNWLKATNQIPPTFLNFLITNGYWNGTSFAFSERFIAILDGTSINGNVMQSGYRIFPEIGLIPRSMLEWTVAEAAQYPNQSLMDTSYYDPSVITDEMKSLGQQFLSFIQEFDWGWIGQNNGPISLTSLRNGLLTSPLALAVPVNVPGWNQQFVPYGGGTTTDHCVCEYEVDTVKNPLFPVFFTDQYQPWLKQFASNYYIPVAIAFNIVLKPEPVTSVVMTNKPVAVKNGLIDTLINDAKRVVDLLKI